MVLLCVHSDLLIGYVAEKGEPRFETPFRYASYKGKARAKRAEL